MKPYEFILEYKKLARKNAEEFCRKHSADFNLLDAKVEDKLKKNNDYSPVSYINDLLNTMCDDIAQKEGKNFEDVKEEYIRAYL